MLVGLEGESGSLSPPIPLIRRVECVVHFLGFGFERFGGSFFISLAAASPTLAFSWILYRHHRCVVVLFFFLATAFQGASLFFFLLYLMNHRTLWYWSLK